MQIRHGVDGCLRPEQGRDRRYGTAFCHLRGVRQAEGGGVTDTGGRMPSVAGTENLRLCAWCNGNFTEQAYLHEKPWHPGDQPEWYCNACTRKITAAWNPQIGGVVKLLRGLRQSHRPTYVVLDIDGDMFRIRQLGLPESPALRASWTARPFLFDQPSGDTIVADLFSVCPNCDHSYFYHDKERGCDYTGPNGRRCGCTGRPQG